MRLLPLLTLLLVLFVAEALDGGNAGSEDNTLNAHPSLHGGQLK